MAVHAFPVDLLNGDPKIHAGRALTRRLRVVPVKTAYPCSYETRGSLPERETEKWLV
jgi:hypothetical protein